MLGQLEVDRGYPGVRDNSAGTSIDTSMDTSIHTSIHTSINSSPDTEEENKSQASRVGGPIIFFTYISDIIVKFKIVP